MTELPDWDGQNFADLLALTREGEAQFSSQLKENNNRGALFGGQVLAQAMRAAQATISTPAHVLQAEFLRAGRGDVPVDYGVEQTRDGRGFSTRRVMAVQHGRQILHAQISFTAGESGPRFLPPTPDVKMPDELEDEATLALRFAERLGRVGAHRLASHKTVMMRFVEPERMLLGEPGPPRQLYWMRLRHVGSDDDGAHACGVAYLSDYWLGGVFRSAATDWEEADRLRVHSLNHSMYFHDRAAADEWLLFDAQCLWSDHGRTLAMAQVYAPDGRPVATVVQEALLRAG